MKRIVSSSSLVLFSIISPMEICVFFYIGLLFKKTNILLFLIITIAVHILFTYIFYMVYQNAFNVITINSEGLRTRHISVDWENAICVSICEVKLYQYSLLPTVYIDVLCISETEKVYDFTRKNTDCIFIEMTKNNLDILREFVPEGAKEIRELI